MVVLIEVIMLKKILTIESILEKVLNKLAAKGKTALVVFTGGASGFNESLSELRELLKDGWHLKVALSTSAEYIFTPQLIKEQLNIDEVYLETQNTGLKPLYEDVSMLILPTLTTNTTAKIACGITDTMTTNLALHAITSGIPVIAATNSSELTHIDRVELGLDNYPIEYKRLFNSYLKTLESFGVKLVQAIDIYQAVQKHINLKEGS